MKKFFIITTCVTFMSIALAGCNGTYGTETTDHHHRGSDEMWSESKSGAELEIFVQDGKVYTKDKEYQLTGFPGYEELEDGKNYKLTADVTFLNGGVAGYVDYPQIERVISIEEIKNEE